MALDAIAKKRAVEINGNEDKLRQSGPSAMKDTKHSRFLPRAQIQGVSIGGGAQPKGWPVVTVLADKKLKLHFPTHSPDTVRAFFEPLLAQR